MLSWLKKYIAVIIPVVKTQAFAGWQALYFFKL
jgi:hypothetical protein